MEQKLFEKVNIIRDKKAYALITGILFPVLILLFCFVKVNQGADISDSTYSPTNFMFTDRLDIMWYTSTALANFVGSILVKLPLGNTLLMMNVYTGVFKAITALVAYFFFTKTVKADRELAFAGTIAAVGLCWCPTTILYNYLTYLFFLLGTVLLYKGIVRAKNSYLLLAGFCLGLNVFVRFANLSQAALIVVLWAYCLIEDKTFKESFFKTLHCVGGYILGIIPGLIVVWATRGFGSVYTGISQLFTMSDEVDSYSIAGMIYATIRTYMDTWPWMEITFFMLVVSMLAFLVFPTKLTWVRYLLGTIVAGGFSFFLYKKALFTRDYTSYGSIYRFGALILVIMIIWFIVHALNRKAPFEERILSFMGVVIIAVTPLGSNNDIYANLNNMFFVFPLFFFLLVRFVKSNEYLRGIRWSVLLLTLLFVMQSVLFGFKFAFRDGTYDEKRTAEITGIPAAKGMMTTEAHKKELETLMKVWNQRDLGGAGILLYGEISGLGFYVGETPAINTAWPSLASYSESKFETEMTALDERIAQGADATPPIIISNVECDAVLNNPESKKQKILNEFIAKYQYEAIYCGDRFTVLAAE
ncbi:hypothetical protein SAMN02910339_00429 [Lachnospiraceae bacterium YSD2013]|nr:hypothetical protein SAMN02910339_00429 [Lachnospiraceae bacterium YSD2013]